jgi:outer membrane protein OmpA-like peptidoglycan-associated protein
MTKKIKLIAVIIVMAYATSLNAQDRSLPRHEFSVIDFAGQSTLKYKAEGLKVSNGLGGGHGLGYTYFFNDKWGITTGIEVALYKAKASAASFVTGQYYVETLYDEPEELILAGNLRNFAERQRTLQLQIPLMAQFMLPLSAAKTHFLYAALGGRLGYTSNSRFKQQSDKFDVSYYAEWLDTPPEYFKALPSYEYSKKLDLRRINLMLSAELGFRWKLADNIALYTGVYVDYGLSNIAPPASAHAPFELQPDDLEYPSIWEINRSEHYSVLGAHKPDRYANAQYTRNNARYTETINTFGAGLKIKIALGKTPKRQPEPAPTVEPRIDTVVREIVKIRIDTVVKEVIREVPQDIKQIMTELSNTLFRFGKFNLSAESEANLQKVIGWLNNNPKINVEIAGHTDNTGSAEYNQTLSENRAKSVYDYLISQGIAASRLSYKGYGLAQPVADNDSDRGRQQNRRVELKIK